MVRVLKTQSVQSIGYILFSHNSVTENRFAKSPETIDFTGFVQNVHFK